MTRPTAGSGQEAEIAHRAVYTAFGELIEEGGTVNTRYGYAGAYGCQSANSQEPAAPFAELGWLHVGERYYDPSTGRFAQRDPIGIRGGVNTYEYVRSQPTSLTDAACCYGSAPCAVVAPGACGGTYQGDGTTCTLHLCCVVMGDLSGNGVVNGADIQGFVDAMLAGFDPCADLAAPYDTLDMADVSAFVSLLLGS